MLHDWDAEMQSETFCSKIHGRNSTGKQKLWNHPFVWILQMYILVSDEHASITELFFPYGNLAMDVLIAELRL